MLSPTWIDSPPVRALRKLAGPREHLAVDCVLRLISYARIHFAAGVIPESKIADAASWPDAPSEFVEFLKSACLMEECQGGLAFRDWLDTDATAELQKINEQLRPIIASIARRKGGRAAAVSHQSAGVESRSGSTQELFAGVEVRSGSAPVPPASRRPVAVQLSGSSPPAREQQDFSRISAAPKLLTAVVVNPCLKNTCVAVGDSPSNSGSVSGPVGQTLPSVGQTFLSAELDLHIAQCLKKVWTGQTPIATLIKTWRDRMAQKSRPISHEAILEFVALCTDATRLKRDTEENYVFGYIKTGEHPSDKSIIAASKLWNEMET